MAAQALVAYMERPEKVVLPASEPSSYEWEMVQRAQSLDEEALSWLYQLYYPKVYNYALVQVSDVQNAEDIASMVMLKVLESLGGYKYRGVPFSAWVFRIARNQIIDMHRKRKRHGEVELNEAIASGSDSDPQPTAELAVERSYIQAALVQLTEDQRQVIVLKFMHGFDNITIGRILGRSEGAIKSLQHRALLALRRQLAGDVL